MFLSVESNPLTAHLPEAPGLTPEQRAIERFAISGNAIVTGGAGDIGIAACRALLEHGLEGVSIFDLASRFEGTRERIDALRKDFPSRKIVEEVVDVTKEDDIEKGVDSAVKALGSVDILLTFAGIAHGAPAEELAVEDLSKVLDVNMTGSFLCARYVALQMMKQGNGGSILLMSSITAQRVVYPACQAAYAISKAGVRQLKNCLAAEWARYGIRVNSISPGIMRTSLIEKAGADEAIKVWKTRTPLGRLGEPSEVEGTVVMLCGRAGRFITGADIVIDGGALVF